MQIGDKNFQTRADDDGDWAIKAEFDQAGSFDYQIHYQDNQGQQQTLTGQAEIHEITIDTHAATDQDNAGSGKEYTTDSSDKSNAFVQTPTDQFDQHNSSDMY